jgi:hypothetical protein
MQQPDLSRLENYEQVVTRLLALQRDIARHLRDASAVGDGISPLAVRGLALLEGLRSERDGLLTELHHLEVELFNHLMSSLNSNSLEAADSSSK